jgi:phosphotransferase system  glucose/maltose/N-acetylglucosamine-specific IIC component
MKIFMAVFDAALIGIFLYCSSGFVEHMNWFELIVLWVVLSIVTFFGGEWLSAKLNLMLPRRDGD